MGQDPRASIRHVSATVDHNIHLYIVNKLCDLIVVLISDIVKLIECPHQAVPHVAAIVRTERKCHDFEAGAVMEFEQFCRQVSIRMLVKADGQVGNSDLISSPNLALPQFPRIDRDLMTDKCTGASQLQQRIATPPEE